MVLWGVDKGRSLRPPSGACYSKAPWGCSSAGRAPRLHRGGQGLGRFPLLGIPVRLADRLWYSCERRGAVAQLGEHLNGIEGVKGSTPFSSTTPLL